MIELLPEKGKFYKVNTHCHTVVSDGRETARKIKELYKEKGYSAVCFTDHEVLAGHEELCDDEFVALHGYEIAIKKSLDHHTGWFMPVYHFNAIAKKQDNLVMTRFFRNNPSGSGNTLQSIATLAEFSDEIERTHYDDDWINDFLKALTEKGFLITYCHPEWSLQTREDYINLDHLHAVELINSDSLSDNSAFHYAQLLRVGKRVVPTGGDDFHYMSNRAFGGWTMIKAEALTYDALMEAYERGDCYASEGPEILSLVLDGGKIKVKTSPAAQICLLSEGRYVDYVRAEGELFTYAEFNYYPEKMGSYFRIEVRDGEGYKAFSNAYYTEDIDKKSWKKP